MAVSPLVAVNPLVVVPTLMGSPGCNSLVETCGRQSSSLSPNSSVDPKILVRCWAKKLRMQEGCIKAKTHSTMSRSA